MKISRLLKQYIESWPAMMVGLVAFVIITGGQIVWPKYIDWLMFDDDQGQHFLGWQFFRNSPLLQWPIGANPNYGLDIGSSIVFTDSIPLLAFVFKPLNAFLPETFQYTGLWILICFLLQSFFAWKLLGLATQDKWLRLIGSAFFTFAPVYLYLLPIHFSLSGHWVLLAAIYFYFFRGFFILRWLCLLAATSLIHAYLLVMVCAIWTADLLRRCWQKELSMRRTIAYFFTGSMITIIVMWAAGYFMIGPGVRAGAFGEFHMDLLSLIDPDTVWSKLLPYQDCSQEDGFYYLGLGIMGLVLIAIYGLICNKCGMRYLGQGDKRNNVAAAGQEKQTGEIAFGYKTIIPILIISICFFVYAISNHVTIGSRELFTYNVPPLVEIFAGVFRYSDRFFWPVYYLIYFVVFYIIFSRFRRRIAITICSVLLCVQLGDASGCLRGFHDQFNHPPAWSSPMRSPLWSDISNYYKNIIFVLPHNSSKFWFPLSNFAATNRMAINSGYFARVNPVKERDARSQVANSVISNKLNPDSLYVFEDDLLWKIASNQIASSDLAGVVDGFRIVAPNLRECRTCNTSAIASISVGNSHDFDYKMERISFASNGNGQKYQLYGWSAPEKWGTWSDGDTSLVLLSLSITPKNDLELFLDGYAFLADKHPSQEVAILVNGHHVAALKYDQQSNSGVRVVKIPKAMAVGKNRHLFIKFNFKSAKSPAELFLSGDTRRLGLGIVSLELKAAD